MKNTESLKKYRAMSEKDLVSELKNVKKEQTLATLKVGAGKEDNFSQIEKLRKNIARIKTLLAEKEYGVSDGK